MRDGRQGRGQKRKATDREYLLQRHRNDVQKQYLETFRCADRVILLWFFRLVLFSILKFGLARGRRELNREA